MSNQLKCFIQDAELILEPTEDWWWFFFFVLFSIQKIHCCLAQIAGSVPRLDHDAG